MGVPIIVEQSTCQNRRDTVTRYNLKAAPKRKRPRFVTQKGAVSFFFNELF